MKLFMYIIAILLINVVGDYSLFNMAWDYAFGIGPGLHPYACALIGIALTLVSFAGIASMSE